MNVFHPVKWTRISGGLGDFDMSLLDQFASIPGPYIAGLVIYLLRDPSIGFQITPASSNCGSGCISYLLPGGMTTISPWPFNDKLPNALDYIVRSAPGYQIDFGSIENLPFWPSPVCRQYGSVNKSIQLCIESGNTVSELRAGRLLPSKLSQFVT